MGFAALRDTTWHSQQIEQEMMMLRNTIIGGLAVLLTFIVTESIAAGSGADDPASFFTGTYYRNGAGASFVPSRHRATRHARHYSRHPRHHRATRAVARHSGFSLDGFPSVLAAKAHEIERACGSKIISAYRPGARVAGSGRLSLHASKKAVDMQGNPSCIYAHLQGWPGGYSTDYAAMQHVHLSYDPGGRREWGARFTHYASGWPRVLARGRHGHRLARR